MANEKAAVFSGSAAREIIRTVKRMNKSPRGVPMEETPRVVNPAIMQFVSPTSTTNAHVQIWTVREGDGASVHEQQAVAVVWATGGTFTLTFTSGGAQTTGAIAWNASAATVKAALDALSNITSVTVTGTGTGSDPWIVTFDDAATNFAQMTATSSCTPAIIAGTRYERTAPGTWTARDTVFIEVPNSETPTAGTKYPGSVIGKVYYNGATYLVYMLETVPPAASTIVGNTYLVVDCVTTASLAAYTRTTNVLLANANGTMAAIDGVTPAVGTRFLLKDGAAGSDNGTYAVDSVGSAGSKWQATRTTDADTSAEVFPGQLVVVMQGTNKSNTLWELSTPNSPESTITLNTTSLAYTQLTGFSGAYAYNSGAQSITSSNIFATIITHDSERYDTDGYHSTSSNTSRMTVTEDGYYAFGGGGAFELNATGIRQIRLIQTGTGNEIIGNSAPGDGNWPTYLSASGEGQFGATDYVELSVIQNSGSSLNFSGQFIWIQRLR